MSFPCSPCGQNPTPSGALPSPNRIPQPYGAMQGKSCCSSGGQYGAQPSGTSMQGRQPCGGQYGGQPSGMSLMGRSPGPSGSPSRCGAAMPCGASAGGHGRTPCSSKQAQKCSSKVTLDDVTNRVRCVASKMNMSDKKRGLAKSVIVFLIGVALTRYMRRLVNEVM